MAGAPSGREAARTNDLRREILGNIWHACEQMAKSAEAGDEEALKQQFDNLKGQMAKLKMMAEYTKKGD